MNDKEGFENGRLFKANFWRGNLASPDWKVTARISIEEKANVRPTDPAVKHPNG